jgi:hypothetical protein
MEKKAIKFWQEFLLLKDSLMDIDSLEEKKAEELLEKLDEKLKQYSEGVDFVLGDLTEKGRKITFTAYSDKDYFEDVIRLVENAPIMDFIEVEAFLEPEGKGVELEYEGIKLRSKDLYFLPLESETIKDKVGIRVAGTEVDEGEDYTSACYLLCEKMIGEYYATMLIDYFDVQKLPKDYKEEGYLPLDYLPDFIEWKKSKAEDGKK